MPTLLTSFIAVIAIAALCGALMRLLRQPLLIGYIIAGIIVGPAGYALVTDHQALEVFGTLGVSLLLFLLGLGINPRYIRDVGPVALVAGIAQLVFTSVVGLFLGLWLGYGFLASLYMAVAFTFSSTIIVLRLLQEKGEEDTLYGRIAIGILLVQDLAAMAVFLLLSATERAESLIGSLSLFGLKATGIIVLSVLFVRLLLPFVERVMESHQELALLSSLAFCLSLGWLFISIGFSFELGALAAGLLLSFAPMFREIAARIMPLRDFFLVLFFVTIGMNVRFYGVGSLVPAVAAFSAFVVVGNPVIVYVIMLCLGYTRKTSLFTGLTIAQISEFSLILIALGVKLGHISQDILVIAALVGIITIACSSYLMMFNEHVYKLLNPLLRKFSPRAEEGDVCSDEACAPFELLLFGAHRLGGGILAQAQEAGVPYLVVDFDPHLVKSLQQKHVVARFGSADDPVFLDMLDMSQLKLVVSTIPDHATNEFLIAYMRRRKPQVTLICVSHHASLAMQLYEKGADYVVMPPYLGRRFMIDLFKKHKFKHNKYQEEKEKHIEDLRYLIA